jgi:hypothetical protein
MYMRVSCSGVVSVAAQDRCTQGMIGLVIQSPDLYIGDMPGANGRHRAFPLLFGVDDEAEIGLEL